MSAYDQFLAETKSQQPTGRPSVVPVSVGNQSQPDTAPVVTSAYDRFKQETSGAPAPKATVVTPQVESPSVLSSVGTGLKKVLDWFGKNQKDADEAQFKLKELMTNVKTDPTTGKQVLGSDRLKAYETGTPEEQAKILEEENQKIPFVKFLNSDSGKKITSFVARNSSNIPLKAYASIKALGDTTYDEAYSALEAKSKDPNNNMAEKIFYGVQDSGVQSLIGVLLGLSVSAVTRGRVSPTVATTPYFAAISAEDQRQEKGKVSSIGNIAIDTVGDSVLSGFAESALKSIVKEGGETALKRILKESGKGFTVEGSTEVSQSFLKYANDYKNAQTEEQKQAIVKQLADYVKNGGMAQEFLIGGVSGGIITGGASAIGGGNTDPSMIPKVDPEIDKPEEGSAYETYLKEKGVDLTRPSVEIQKQIENVNAPEGTVGATDHAPIEGVNRDNKVKLTPEEAKPFADVATQRYWTEKIQPAIDKGEPVVIGGDDLKDHFGKDYNDMNHPIYSQSAFDLFKRALEENKGDTVVFTSGGAGSGKTELVTKALKDQGFKGIVYDSNFSNLEGAEKQIKQAQDAGKKIEIRAVLPNLENARKYTILRENETKRAIADSTFARGHAGAPAVIEKLLESGKVIEDQVKMLDTRNTNTMEEAVDKVMDGDYMKNVLDTLKNLGYNEDKIKTTYAKTNFDQTTGQRTNGEVQHGEGSSVTPTQDRTDKGEANGGSDRSVLPKKTKSGSSKEKGIKEKLKEKYPTVDFFLSENEDEINLSKVVVPKESRGTGIGSNFMKDLTEYADDKKKKIVLTPSSDFGGTKSRLIEFYKRFGFVENKGKNKDFSTRETMIRLPQEETPLKSSNSKSKKTVKPQAKTNSSNKEGLFLEVQKKKEDQPKEKKPVFSKASLKGLYKNSEEFKANPVLVVEVEKSKFDGEKKYLAFTGKTSSFRINPTSLGLKDENLKEGQTVTLDPASLKNDGQEIRVMKYEGGTGSSYASIGRYREEGDIKLGNYDQIKPIQFPELVALAKDLTGDAPFVKKYTRANGMFYARGNGEIGLNPDLFLEGNVGQLQKTLAHEIGHLIDYLPDGTMARGNVMGRLAVLKGFTKDFYAGVGATRTNKEVKAELWDLSKYWKPIDEETASEGFLAYRKSAPEVYADFISVLFNDPILAGQKAPASYNIFFQTMDKKPEVKKAYFELQDLLRYGDVTATRRSAVKRMFKLTEQEARERQIENQQIEEAREKSIWFKFKSEFVDQTEVVKEAVKKAQESGTVINPDDNPTYYLEERNYIGGKIKAEVDIKYNSLYQELQDSGMSWADLGELMFYERIEKGDRKEVANPLGYQPDFVKDLMEVYEDVGQVKADNQKAEKGRSDMKSVLGEEKYLRLKNIAENYRKSLKSFFEQGVEEGIYSSDMSKMFAENAYYVPFKGAKYSGVSRTTFGVKQMKGTLGDIENPANTGIEKSVSIIRAIERNKVARKTIEFYKENFPEEVEIAPKDQNGYPIEPKDKSLGMVTYMQDGKPQGYIVDKYIAEAVQKMSTGQMNQLMQALRFFNSGLFRPLFITFNMGFQSFNAIRDFKRFWKNVPNMTVLNATKLYIQSARAAKIRAFGLPENPSAKDIEANDLINRLEKEQVLSITFNDIIKGEDIEDAQIDRILRETGVREAHATRLGKIGDALGLTRQSPIIKQAFQILDFIEKTGNLIETIPKVAGVKALEGKMPAIEMRSFVRKYVGSPDFLAGGRDKRNINEVFLFANAIAQGIRSDYEIATKPKSRGAYWLKTVQSELLPKLLMLMATYGIFGDWLKDFFDKVGEYDKANYTVIPMGIDENGKAKYFRMPSDESGRLIGGIFWKAFKSFEDPEKLAELKTYTDILSFAGGQIPSFSPVVDLTIHTLPTYLAGNNPYDFFRGRPILTDEQQLAGGTERLKPFMAYLFQQLGGGVFMKLYTNETVPRNPTLSEKVVDLPLISNIAGRFIKTSDYGETEKLREITNEVRSDKARESISNKREVFSAVQDAYGKSYGEQQAIKKQMIKDILGDKINTKDLRDKKNSLEKRFTTLIIRGEADPKVDALVTAQSNDEKVALLTEYQKTMSKSEFEDLRKFIIKNRVVSSQAYRDFIVNKNKK